MASVGLLYDKATEEQKKKEKLHGEEKDHCPPMVI
jgi:hypothetical protein